MNPSLFGPDLDSPFVGDSEMGSDFDSNSDSSDFIEASETSDASEANDPSDPQFHSPQSTWLFGRTPRSTRVNFPLNFQEGEITCPVDEDDDDWEEWSLQPDQVTSDAVELASLVDEDTDFLDGDWITVPRRNRSGRKPSVPRPEPGLELPGVPGDEIWLFKGDEKLLKGKEGEALSEEEDE